MTAIAAAIALRVAALVQTVYVAADVARCESSARYDDGAVVLQTAANRARKWRRPLLSILLQRAQFAHGCPERPRTWSPRHLVLGIEAATGNLRVPTWARDAMLYCGPSDTPAACQDLRRDPVGRVVHVYYRGSK